MESNTFDVIIVDDEIHAIEALRSIIEPEFPQLNVVETFADPVKAMAFLAQNSIDVLFLDISMPEVNGFELLESLIDIDFDIVFVTAFDKHAIEAIRWSALDYLLKPVAPKDLASLLLKLSKKKKDSEGQLSYLKGLMNGSQKLEKLLIPSAESIEVISIADIKFVQSENNYVRVFLKDGRVVPSTRHLKSYEEQFAAGNAPFFRVHQSYLVNVDHVSAFLRENGGMVRLLSGEQVPVARRKRESFLNLLKSRAS